MWIPEQRKRYKDNERRYPSGLLDAEWDVLAPLLLVYRPLSADLREMVNACRYLHRTGCGWRYLPSDFGAWETVRTWHDRFRADGLWADITALLVRAVREQRAHAAEPSTVILDSQSVKSGPQAGKRGVDGNKRINGIKRHVITCSLGFVLGIAVTPANVHDTQAVTPLLERVAVDGWRPERIKVDGIYAGPRIEAAAARFGVDVQVSSRDAGVRDFRPLPLRWRIENTFGIHTNFFRRLTRNLEQSPAAAEDAVVFVNCQTLLRNYTRV